MGSGSGRYLYRQPEPGTTDIYGLYRAARNIRRVADSRGTMRGTTGGYTCSRRSPCRRVRTVFRRQYGPLLFELRADSAPFLFRTVLYLLILPETQGTFEETRNTRRRIQAREARALEPRPGDTDLRELLRRWTEHAGEQELKGRLQIERYGRVAFPAEVLRRPLVIENYKLIEKHVELYLRERTE